jgi:hypothetical protein
MLKRLTAKYRGKCTSTGQIIKPGDIIDFDIDTRSAYLVQRTVSKNYISDIFNFNGNEYYRNKNGLCIDAPCCGCCTI